MYTEDRRHSERSPIDRRQKMDSRYWKGFENMGDMDNDKRSGSEEPNSRFMKDSKNSDSSRRKRSQTRSRSQSSSSSSSGGSSSRSSSSSDRRQSDEKNYRNRKPDAYQRKESSSRVRSTSYGSNGSHKDGRRSAWFAQNHNYPNQNQDMPPSTSYLPPFPQGPPSVQGQYPPNCQGQNFGNNYHSYPGYDSSSSYYAHGSQPPPPSAHEYPLSGGGGPSGPPNHPPANWELFGVHDPGLALPILQGSGGQTMPSDIKSDEAKKEAIEQELLQQKRTLSKQREDYVIRKFSLSRELNRLKDQKRDLIKEKSKDNDRILRENAKLQGEILQKLKSIDNVIEMLSNIIGDSARLPDVIKEIKNMEKEKNSEKPKKVIKKKHSPQAVDERSRNPATEKDGTSEEYQEGSRIYYDPGLHWCSDCNIFPKSVTEYLEHLHSPSHKNKSTLRFEDFPWHVGKNLRDKTPPYNKDAPPKRIPIRAVLNVSVSINRHFTISTKELVF